MARVIERTAYHEAGHAVVAIVNNIKFRYVTILPNDSDNSLGHIKWCRRFGAHKNAESFLSQTFIKHGLITLSGICAEKIKFGSYAWNGFGEDHDESDHYKAVECFLRAGIDDATPFYVRTEFLLREHWEKIEAVANVLLRSKTLPYRGVVDLIK